MVFINEELVKKLLVEVAPRVEELTGWSTHLDSLKVRIINRNQLWEEVSKPKLEHLGISTQAKTREGKRRKLIKRFLEPFITYAQYSTHLDSVIVVKDNISFRTNESGLAVVVGHEVFHRAQLKNNPQFSKMCDAMLIEMSGGQTFDEVGYEGVIACHQYPAFRSLLEGDASFVENQLKERFYPDAKKRSSISSTFVGTLLFLHSMKNGGEGLIETVSPYTKGRKIVERVYKSRGRKGVNELYNLDREKLSQVFL